MAACVFDRFRLLDQIKVLIVLKPVFRIVLASIFGRLRSELYGIVPFIPIQEVVYYVILVLLEP